MSQPSDSPRLLCKRDHDFGVGLCCLPFSPYLIQMCRPELGQRQRVIMGESLCLHERGVGLSHSLFWISMEPTDKGRKHSCRDTGGIAIQ